MTTTETLMAVVAAAPPAVPAPAAGGDPTTGGLGGLGALAGVFPVLAGAYLAYLVVRMLIPAVLIFCTIRMVPAGQRSALLQTYLGATSGFEPDRDPADQRSARPRAVSAQASAAQGRRHA
jgi:hypothetical protein